MAKTMKDGLLYVISASAYISEVADLKGTHLAVPLRGDTPEIILSQLLRAAGLEAEKDLKITYTGTPIEAMQMLLAGRVDAALTAEPASKVAQLKGKMAGKTIYRAIDIQTACSDMTGAAPMLAASVPHCNLVARNAAEAREDVERMLSAMAGEDLKKIGGKLPDDGFYLG
ncbi:MAG: ABC transporter substrate-binding protein [Epibacterium sp.]|nr:ABC transporter substrate-binding protein [Epibacterium sp.]